ncbi:MAG: hypothetical protein BM565_13840 [Gammaproteobacteria bacterium MedPE]|nr:MAG: hypothetical protein BM565_13840 [Gammaproteobacteria bacterium MedPE]
MKMRYLLIGSLLSFSSLAFDKQPDDKKLIDKLAKLLEEKGAFKSISNAELDGFKMESAFYNALGKGLKPSKTTTHSLFISNQKTMNVSLSVDDNKENSNGVSIYQKNTGQSYVSVSDSDGDGVLDFITYSILDKDGKLLSSVEDFGMDGQIDFKIDFVKKTAWVFWENEWRESVREEGGAFIQFGDKKIAISDALKILGRYSR